MPIYLKDDKNMHYFSDKFLFKNKDYFMVISWVKIEWISDEKGYGLVATRDIPKGTITFVQDGLDIVLNEKDLGKIDEKLLSYVETYSYEDYMGNRIISWDFGKYMNHDDQANTLSTGYGFEIAVNDIKKNQEVTDDYRIFSTYHDTSFKTPPAKIENLKPWPDELIKQWDQKISEAILNIEDIQQPLKDFVEPEIYQSVIGFKNKKLKYRSVQEALPLRYRLQTESRLS